MLAATLAAGPLLFLTATAAHAGIIDGSLNDLHAADHSNVLGALVGSQLTGADNNNANTKADNHHHGQG